LSIRKEENPFYVGRYIYILMAKIILAVKTCRNLALGKSMIPDTQRTLLTIDGLKDSLTAKPVIIPSSSEPWLAIDLGSEETVAYVHIYNHPIGKYLFQRTIWIYSIRIISYRCIF